MKIDAPGVMSTGPHSMFTPLFTELGLIPLRYQHLILALRYAGYMVHLPATHYVKAALEDSYQLFVNGHPGYWTDLVYALSNLKYPVMLPALPDVTPEGCVALGKAVYTSAMKHVEAEVSTSTHLYMLHDRCEPLDNESPRKITVKL
jgi:hypothetical protein